MCSKQNILIVSKKIDRPSSVLIKIKKKEKGKIYLKKHTHTKAQLLKGKQYIIIQTTDLRGLQVNQY